MDVSAVEPLLTIVVISVILLLLVVDEDTVIVPLVFIPVPISVLLLLLVMLPEADEARTEVALPVLTTDIDDIKLVVDEPVLVGNPSVLLVLLVDVREVDPTDQINEIVLFESGKEVEDEGSREIVPAVPGVPVLAIVVPPSLSVDTTDDTLLFRSSDEVEVEDKVVKKVVPIGLVVPVPIKVVPLAP